MKDLALTIPGDVLANAKIPRARMESELKKELALQLYREGIVSGFGACRIAGIEKSELQYLLGERGIAQHYDVEHYEQDLEAVAEWQAPQLNRQHDAADQFRRDRPLGFIAGTVRRSHRGKGTQPILTGCGGLVHFWSVSSQRRYVNGSG